MSEAAKPEIVIAGNLLVDDIVLGDGRTLMGEPGGAVLYGALAAALWGARVGVVSVLGNDYPRAALDALAARGVDLAGLHASEAPSLRTSLRYELTGRRLLHQPESPSHAAVSPDADRVPAAWWRAPILHVAPMPRAVQLGYAARGAARLTADPHEPIRLDPGAPRATDYARFDGLFVGHEELELSGEPSEQARAIDVRAFVAIKRAAAGGWCFDASGDCGFEWQARADLMVDATGAGDAFAAGFLVGWLRGEPLERCCQRGVVSASFALADWGARGLIAPDRRLAERRLAEWFGD